MDLNLGTVSNWEVVGGTAGVVSPWAQSSGTFAGTLQQIQHGAASFVAGAPTLSSDAQSQGVFPGGSNPEGIGTTLDPSKSSVLNSGNVSLSGANWTDTINAYFVRGVVIILGFIFVAAGLALLGKGPAVEVAKAVMK